MSGDRLYAKSRHENHVVDRYLFPEDLSRELQVMDRTVLIDEIAFVCNGLYPATRGDIDKVVQSLSGVLEAVMIGDSETGGFLFTGLLVTVAFGVLKGGYMSSIPMQSMRSVKEI